MAMTGSSRIQPVKCTTATATMTPTVVHTSVSRWCASASRVMERCSRAPLSRNHPHRRFAPAASTESASPRPTCSSGCGERSLGTALQMMAPAATKMRAPSMPLEKYSAFSWPKLWSSSSPECA